MMRLVKPFWTLVKASRLLAWIFGPTLFTIGVIHGQAFPKSTSLAICMILQTLTFSFPLCIIIFGINDIYDYDSDIRNPRKLVDGLEGGILSPEDHRLVLVAAYYSTLLIIFSAIMNQRWHNIIAVIAMVFLGWQYSSPPLRLKEIPILDSLSNGLIVYLAWFCGFSFSNRRLTDTSPKGLLLALCTSGIHALGAATDVDADRIAGQKTIAVALGTRTATAFGALCYLVAAATVDKCSIFGGYAWSGFLLMGFSSLFPVHIHSAFKVTVYASIAGALLWVASRSHDILQRIQRA